MASNIEKGQLYSDKNIPQPTMVYSDQRALDQLFRLILAEAAESKNKRTIAQVTCALMCRLRIPHTSTIIGMLGVGLSRSNFEEISKWIARELPTVAAEGVQDFLQVLERRFRKVIDQFPED